MTNLMGFLFKYIKFKLLLYICSKPIYRSVMEQQNSQEQLSVEELEARKEEMLKFYTESLPYLEAQFKYEDLLTKIDESRFKRANIQIQYAMMMQAQQEQDYEPEIDPEEEIGEQKQTQERKLKKN